MTSATASDLGYSNPRDLGFSGIDDPEFLTVGVDTVFTNGYCHAMALVLHERTGWPIVGLHSRKEGFSEHYLVRRPDGHLVDVHGARTEADVLQAWDGGSGYYTVRGYTPESLWAEVHQVDMEDPMDVWTLAQHVASELVPDQPRPAFDPSTYSMRVDKTNSQTMRATMTAVAASARADAATLTTEAQELRRQAAALSGKERIGSAAEALLREAVSREKDAEARLGLAAAYEQTAAQIA